MLYIKISCCGGDDAHGNDYEMMCDLFTHVVFASNCWGLSMGGDYCLFDADDAKVVADYIRELDANYPQYIPEYLKTEIITKKEVDAL